MLYYQSYFSVGKTREEARRALVLALKGIDVRGDIRTTVEYLIKLLETKEFKENDIDTRFAIVTKYLNILNLSCF